METTGIGLKVHRRRFLQTAAGAMASGGLASYGFGQICPAKPGTVRDRLWVFCNPVNADYGIVLKRSVISPFESAVYMGVPNIIMVNQYPEAGQEGWYKPWEPPFELYAFPLKVLKRVVWSIVGAGGVTKDSERQRVLAMAHHTTNFVGVFLDDFFREAGSGNMASLTLDQMREIQKQPKGSDKKLDLYVTLYTNQLNSAISDYLKLIDVVTLWTWETAELANLEKNLTKLERLAPKSRVLLGCYTTDYDKNRTPGWTALPVPKMQHQCKTGLRWLREGRIEGIIIYGNFLDLNWEVVEWTREWVQKIGDTRI
jgi:hypothetical protein